MPGLPSLPYHSPSMVSIPRPTIPHTHTDTLHSSPLYWHVCNSYTAVQVQNPAVTTATKSWTPPIGELALTRIDVFKGVRFKVAAVILGGILIVQEEIQCEYFIPEFTRALKDGTLNEYRP